MKKNEKKAIMVLILIVVIIIGVLVWRNIGKKEESSPEENKVKEEFVQVLEDGTKLNTSGKFSQKRTVDGLEVSNIQLTHNNGISVLLADVRNVSGTDKKEITPVTITLLDKEGNKIQDIDGIIDPVKAEETVQLNMALTADYANAYDFKIEKQ